MMFSLRRPTETQIAEFLAEQTLLELTYTSVGSTQCSNRPSPKGYITLQEKAQIGQGERTYRAAVAALRCWQQFDLGWVQAGPRDTPLQQGEVVSVLARVFGVWILNASRIVYVLDEVGPITQFAFAYGTLPGHVESGEERFTVSWNRGDNIVWYAIDSFSRPNHWAVTLGKPVARMLQRKFARDSVKAVLRAVESTRMADYATV